MWNFIIYAGAGSDITNIVDEPDNQQSLKTFVRQLFVGGQLLQFIISV